MDLARSFGTPATQEDIALFMHIEQTLYTAVISDSLDDLGFRDQAMQLSMMSSSTPVLWTACHARLLVRKCLSLTTMSMHFEKL